MIEFARRTPVECCLLIATEYLLSNKMHFYSLVFFLVLFHLIAY